MKLYHDGLIAENNVKDSEEVLEVALLEAAHNLVMAKATFQKVTDVLNYQMGQKQGTIYERVDRPMYSKPEKLDIEAHIQR
jgi:hypothetical protein